MVTDGLRLYSRYVGVSLRSQMQYRISFLLYASGHFMITGLEFLGFVALFQRFGQIRGWTLPQMALFYGMISTSFAIAEAAFRGFDIFGRLIKAGDFDRLLLRPRALVFQVLGQEFQFFRIGRLSQGLFVLLWAASQLDIVWTPGHIALLLFAIAGGVCLFGGLFILQATLCFWTTESIELVNCATYGGVETAQFPLSIYRPWFQMIFTFVIPLATINYFPAHVLLMLDDPLGSTRAIQWLSPVAGVVFLFACTRFWAFGVRRYTSTGS